MLCTLMMYICDRSTPYLNKEEEDDDDDDDYSKAKFPSNLNCGQKSLVKRVPVLKGMINDVVWDRDLYCNIPSHNRKAYSTSQTNFAVGRPSAADRSVPLIAACRLRPVTAGSGRLRLFSHIGLYSTPCYKQRWIPLPAYQSSHSMSRRSLPPGWRAATPFEACTCMHFAHCTPVELSRYR